MTGPHDYEPPVCRRCGDTGWDGAGDCPCMTTLAACQEGDLAAWCEQMDEEERRG